MPIKKRDHRAPQPEDALDFILYEHLRHREMCNALDRLADDKSFNAEEVAALADFIRSDLTLHTFDEEETLFPLLRQRCTSEDDIEGALSRLNKEHEADRELSAEVRTILYKAVSEQKAPSRIAGGREALHAFAQSQRRHMMLENAVLIPLARRRLTAADLAALGRRLAAQRQHLVTPPNC